MNDDDDEIRIIACQPVILERMRSLGIPLEGMPPVTDLYQRGEYCEACCDEVWVGPRQNAVRQLMEHVHVLCYPCALLVQHMSGDDDIEIRDLGGGSRVEGTEITPEPDEEQVAYVSMAPGDFPFDIEIFRQDTGEVLWRTTVDGPGAMSVPGFGSNGYRVGVRSIYPNGKVETCLYEESQ